MCEIHQQLVFMLLLLNRQLTGMLLFLQHILNPSSGHIHFRQITVAERQSVHRLTLHCIKQDIQILKEEQYKQIQQKRCACCQQKQIELQLMLQVVLKKERML